MENKLYSIILLGGKSSRLNSSYKKIGHIHKSLLKINNQTILESIIKNYVDYKINHFILAVGYKGKTIKDYFLTKKRIAGKKINLIINNKSEQINNENEINIIVYQTKINDTKYERVKKIIKKFNIDSFHLTYGDGYANINIKNIMNLSKDKNTDAVITLAKIKSQYGHIIKRKKSKNFSLIEKPFLDDPINIGYMFFNKSSLKFFNKYNFKELENGLLNLILKKNRLKLNHHKKYWKSIDNFKDLQDLRSHVRKINEK